MKRTNHSAESGNALVVVLVALLVAAVGGLAYTSSKLMEKEGGDAKTAPAAQQTAAAGQAGEQPAAPQIEIKPGNPVVAKVGDQEITRLDVFNFMQTLPANTRQLPIAQLFPVVQDQVVNTRLLREKSKGAKLDNDPLVKERIQAAKDQIVPVVFMQREVEKALTEERLKKAYDAYKEGFPNVQEVNAKHILVDDEKLAAKLIKDIEGGASFEELAKENSKDPTAEKGGDLGYFTQRDVVPEFAQVAFSLEPGSVSKEPVKTQFGFHVIKVEEKRKRPPASFEDAKPFLEGQLRQIIAAEIVQGWRADAGIELFDINGDDIEPAAGDEQPAKAE
jgi:peptidyl-prolyl cis-trans isomerase C